MLKLSILLNRARLFPLRAENAEHWKTSNETWLTGEAIEALLRNEVAAIRIPGFATPEECRQLEDGIERVGFDFYENVDPPIGRIGITQFEHRDGRKSEYFAAAPEAYAKQKRVAQKAFDPIQRFGWMLRQASNRRIDIATEPGKGEYFAGLYRQINRALLHADWAPLDAPGWAIGENRAQLAWNLYVKSPDDGGECVVHNVPWQPEYEELKVPDSYGYSPELVADAESVRLKPKVGDVTIFNSRNFHEVLGGGDPGSRITLSSFVGESPDGRLVLWS